MSDDPGSGNLDLRPMKIMTVPSQATETDLSRSMLNGMAGAHVFPILRQVSLSVPNSDATCRIMRLLSGTFARMSLIVRGCVGRGRDRQSAFRSENKLPKSAKIPYEPQELTDAEKAEIRVSAETVRGLFGDVPADYALEKAQQTAATGDLRAFKIRLLFIKVRDSLKGSSMYNEFLDGIEDAISLSEEMAGCKPDNSPRRMSKAEQERKRRIQEKLEEKKRIQPELPLIWPSKNEHEPSHDDAVGNRCEQVINNDEIDDDRLYKKSNTFQYIEKSASGHDDNCAEKTVKNDDYEQNNEDENLTVKDKRFKCKFYSKNPLNGEGPVRKTRDYDNVGQIIDDIESGAIVRYESTEEIKEDLKAGKITAVDALMFTAALETYCDSFVQAGKEEDDELEKEFGDACDPDEFSEDGYGNEDDDMGFEEEDGVYGSRFCDNVSYDPRGFEGIDGRFSASGDWDRDDAW